jgi:hypothetical protein
MLGTQVADSRHSGEVYLKCSGVKIIGLSNTETANGTDLNKNGYDINFCVGFVKIWCFSAFVAIIFLATNTQKH